MKTQNKMSKWLAFIIREAFIFAMIAAFAGLTMMDQTPSENFRYPLSATPEIQELYTSVGRWLFVWGYPCIALLRIFIHVRRKFIRKKEQS